jgi:hypothetical protein
MSESAEYDFDKVNLDETATAEDIEKATFEQVPGKFICVVGKPKLTTKVTKDFTNDKTGKFTKGYMSYAVDLELFVTSVLEIDKPIMEKGKQLERDGIPQTRKVQVFAEEQTSLNALYDGLAFEDQVRMFHNDEKQGTANRRMKIAIALGIMKPGVTLTAKDWGGLEGKRVVLNTVWNKWMKDGVEMKNVKIDYFDGYELCTQDASQPDQPGSAEDDDFDDM